MGNAPSKAEAGLIGNLSDEGVHIMAQEGYGDQLNLYKDKPLPLELPSMVKAVKAENPKTYTSTLSNKAVTPRHTYTNRYPPPARKTNGCWGFNSLVRKALQKNQEGRF